MKHKFSSMGRVAIALVLALSLSLVMAAPVSATTMTVTATPVNAMAGATTNYAIGFTTATTDTIVSVEMEFDAGFDVSAAAFSSKSGTISAGTVSVSGQVVTYTVTTPASISSSTAITITLSGIVNPATGDYEVTVRTKDAFEDVIDQGIDEVVTITAAPVSFAVVVGTQAAGTAFTVGITAKDEAAGAGSDVEGYTGLHLIDFTSTATDPKTIPAFEVVSFTDGAGTTSESFVLNVVETGRTITATDTELSVSGTSDPFSVGLGSVDYLTITGAPTSVIAGEAFTDDIIVTAYDAAGNVMTTNTSEVAWTSTDTAVSAGAGLPVAQDLVLGTYTFTGADFTLETAGVLDEATTLPWTITATVGSLTRVASIIVNPAAASQLAVAAATDPIVANGYDSSVITATVLDEFSNLVKTSTDITFETSVGGFTEASGASTYTVAFAYHGSPDYDYYAEATLTSTDGGTATVKVTSGTLTYDTVEVVLTADTAPTEVWVDGDYASGLYNDGHDWNVDAFDEIELGTDDVAEGGTVNVAVGTYTLANTIDIATAGITLQSTGTTALTIIDCDATYSGINITAADVTVDGFTVLDAVDGGYAIQVSGADAIVTDNIMTAAAGWPEGIALRSDGALVSGNELDMYNTMMLFDVSDCTLSTNTFDAGINVQANSTSVSGITITGNDIIGSVGTGIVFQMADNPIDDVLIEGNTISRTTGSTFPSDAAISFGAGCTGDNSFTNIRITGNDITDNEGVGIGINSSVTWGTGNTISNNNIVGNCVLGIDNGITTTVIDASNNWWGDATGPYHDTTNLAGSGDVVDDAVDYRPWLAAAHAMPADPVTSDTISLVTGWNLISLPIIPTSSVIATVLADLITDETVDEVRTYDQGDWDNWASTGPAGDLTIMADGAGYWIDMNAADSLVVAGSELPAPPATPPSYSVYTGWNMIGFKSVDTDTTVAAYLGTMVAGTLEAIYGYDAAASAYFIPGVTSGHDFLEPGCGYWLAVNAAGTIYP